MTKVEKLFLAGCLYAVNSFKDFINRAVGYEIIRAALERGLCEWGEESQQNN